MDMSLFNSVLIGMLVGGIINIYKDNLNKKSYAIDRNKVRRFLKTDIKKIPVKNVKLKYSKKIEYFNNVIKNKLPYVSLEKFDMNIYDLVINEKEMNVDGNYSVESNLMNLLPDDKEDAINHELFHVSSSMMNGKVYYCGFRQVSDDFDIGRGINEGYTELLNNRYFEVSFDAYKHFQILDLLIEKIIGQEKMTKMYFDADLYGLIEEFSKYCDKNMAYELVEDIDILFNDIEENNIKYYYSEGKINHHQKIARRVTEILLSSYINYLKFSVQEGLLTLDELGNLLVSFANDLSIGYKVRDFNIEYLTPELFYEVKDIYLPKNEYDLNFSVKTASK